MPEATMVSRMRQVLPRRGVGLFGGRDALAEIVERQQQAAIGQRRDGLDGFLDRFAGDEAPREARFERHPVARRQPLQNRDLREGVEECLRCGVEHQ